MVLNSGSELKQTGDGWASHRLAWCGCPSPELAPRPEVDLYPTRLEAGLTGPVPRLARCFGVCGTCGPAGASPTAVGTYSYRFWWLAFVEAVEHPRAWPSIPLVRLSVQGRAFHSSVSARLGIPTSVVEFVLVRDSSLCFEVYISRDFTAEKLRTSQLSHAVITGSENLHHILANNKNNHLQDGPPQDHALRRHGQPVCLLGVLHSQSALTWKAEVLRMRVLTVHSMRRSSIAAISLTCPSSSAG
jgi:hypothetical protein